MSTDSASRSRLYVVDERFPGELATLRADNVRLRRLLELSEEGRPAPQTRSSEIAIGRRYGETL